MKVPQEEDDICDRPQITPQGINLHYGKQLTSCINYGSYVFFENNNVLLVIIFAEVVPEGSTFGITRPASQTTPHEQHVKASTVIGERCVPSRLKSAAEFEESCVNVYTEEDLAW